MLQLGDPSEIGPVHHVTPCDHTQAAETLLLKAVTAEYILVPSIFQSMHSSFPGLCPFIDA